MVIDGAGIAWSKDRAAGEVIPFSPPNSALAVVFLDGITDGLRTNNVESVKRLMTVFARSAMLGLLKGSDDDIGGGCVYREVIAAEEGVPNS